MRMIEKEKYRVYACVKKKVCKYEFGCAHVRVCLYTSEKKCVRKRERYKACEKKRLCA